MGIKTTDLRPINPIFPTAISPAAKTPQDRFFQMLRTDVNSRVVAVLPADATLLSVTGFSGVTNSNAGTTAYVYITVTKDGQTIASGTYNAATGQGTTAIIMTGLPNLETLPLGGDIIITAQYAETGTASTTGGPFAFRVSYVR